MIGAIFFMTSRGEVVLSRSFRDGFVIRSVTDIFRDEIVATKQVERCPVNIRDKACYVHLRHGNLLVVAVGRPNLNAFLVIQTLLRILQIVNDYFGYVSESILKENFVVVQEVIDETIDFGYPQITESELLKSYISVTGLKPEALRRTKEAQKITVNATGKIPWRQDGIVYRDNEIFIDVVEEVNLLMSQGGEVLQRDVVGRIVVRSFLSGMPECHMALNDKAMMAEREVTAPAAGGSGGAPLPVQLDDVAFHSCVRLSSYDADRSISFVPPDGEFVLMRYRSSGNVIPPMKVLFSRAKELSKTRMEIDFHLQCDIDPRYHATNVVVKIPCPANTANVKVRVLVGKAKYDAAAQAIVWKMKRMEGGTTTAFSAEVHMITVTAAADKVWGRPPIAIQFASEMFTASGLRVDRLKIAETKMNYEARKWLRYMTQGGQYQCRL